MMPETEPTESTRPALTKLSMDIKSEQEYLLGGLSSKRDLVEWLQRLTVRTLGEVPDAFYEGVAREMRFAFKGGESTFVRAMVADGEVSEKAAKNLRREVWRAVIHPANHRALRKLRKSAGEYLDNPEGGPANHAATFQRHIAMRPSLDELDRQQQGVLADLFDGLDDRDAIIEWAKDVELATHGEITEGFAQRCFDEPSTSAVLTAGDDREVYQRARELFAATYLIPYFNRGVRDLSGRTGERPDAERQDNADLPEWD